MKDIQNVADSNDLGDSDFLKYILMAIMHNIIRKGLLPPLPNPLFKLSPPFSNCAIPPDKQYLLFKNFAFHSGVDAVENVTVKETLISV